MTYIYQVLYLAIFCLSQLSAQEPLHTTTSTSYGKEGSIAYALNRHGSDGNYLLDPYFTPYLEHLENKVILDAGCGPGFWSVYAANHGAKVFGIDIQEAMIDLASKASSKANLTDKIHLTIGDVSSLPYPSCSFDLALSINVGCNLPSTTLINNQCIGLGPHLQEIRRVLKQDGLVILTAPASFGSVFTNGSDRLSVFKHISDVLNTLPLNPSSSEIISCLNELKEVYRATFALVNGKLTLITDECQLSPSQEIWRKLPGLTVPNRYHSESEYLEEIANAGFKIKHHFRPQINSKEALKMFNKSHPDSMHLGEEYIEHNPFVIFCLELR